MLEEHLTATTTGGNGLTVAGDDRHRDESSSTLADEVTHERALGAEGETVTGVLDVGAFYDATLRREASGPHGHFRVRSV